jgi:3-deoxy-D-manno-octulosonic-acid transferase
MLTWLAQPLLRRKLRRRARAEPGYAVAVPERFGYYADAPEQASAVPWCWIHAVSLGEARAAGILIAALRRQNPDWRFLLTHGTATGRAEGAKLLREGDCQVWQPWDTPGAVRRFLDHFAPRIGVLMETEVWPALSTACAERGIPLVLANARLSPRSFARIRQLAWLARPIYASLAAAWAQTGVDALRLAVAGAKVGGVYGNLKFDATPDPSQLACAAALRAKLRWPVIMLASSREGEEQQLLDVIKRHREGLALPLPDGLGQERSSSVPRFEEVQWLIVPRHPQRFDAVAALIEEAGFTVLRRSAGLPDRPDAPEHAPPAIWLGDSLGEMALYYGVSSVALLGGSFEPLGGQNLIEAAACGCPVLMGRSTFNFAEAAELALEAGAALRVDDMAQAAAGALVLLADSARREAMVEAARAFACAHRGAAARTAAAIADVAAGRPVASL